MLLASHFATIAWFLFHGTPMEPGDELWRYFWQALPRLPGWIRGTLTIYGTALVAVLAVTFMPATAHSPDPDDYLRRF